MLSRTIDSAQQFASEFSAQEPVAGYTDIESFLDDPRLDIVVVANPDALHCRYSKAALEANKHVLVEKPLTLTESDGLALKEISRRTGCQVGVGFHMRWHPGIRAALHAVGSGGIGTLRHIGMRWTFQRANTDDWRSDPEFSRWWSLSGVGAHCIDLLRLISNETGLARSSFTASAVRGVLGSANEETTAITATFEQGVTAQLISSVLFASTSELSFYGEEGSLICEGLLGRASKGVLTLNGSPVDYAFANPYVVQIEEFASAVVDGRPFAVSVDAGLQVLADLDALDREL